MKFSKTGLMMVGLGSFLMAASGWAQGVPADGSAPLTYQWSLDGTNYSTDAPEDVNYYYNDLSPYGAWVDLDGYGWCWQPSQVAANPQWQPYCDDGHWVYTDAGWFWESDYPWGWAPFHYGRWLRHERCGWVWFPDRVWGPAWVTWRMAGDQCGWAPLPLHTVVDANEGMLFNGVRVGVNFDFGLSVDCFTFVGLGDFCAPDVAHHRLAQPEVARIYNRTSIINDYRFANQTFVNRGIPVDRVAAATHGTIRPIAIRDEPAGGGGGAPSGVYRRAPHAPDRTVTLRAQKVDERHPVIQHGGTPPANGTFHVAPANNQTRPVPLNAPVRTTETKPQEPIQIGDATFDPNRKEEPKAVNQTPPKANPPMPRSARVASQAHALPPLFQPHDEPAPEPVSKPTPLIPRSARVANQAHALPPLISAPPPLELAKPTSPHDDAVTSPRDNSRQKH